MPQILLLVGIGLNYSVIGSISLARDAVFSSGGQDEMILETDFAQSLALILCGNDSRINDARFFGWLCQECPDTPDLFLAVGLSSMC